MTIHNASSLLGANYNVCICSSPEIRDVLTTVLMHDIDCEVGLHKHGHMGNCNLGYTNYRVCEFGLQKLVRCEALWYFKVIFRFV